MTATTFPPPGPTTARPPAAPDAPLQPAPLLVATDLSEAAAPAARFAHDLAQRWARGVVAAHIVELGFESWWRARYEVLVDAARMAEAQARVRDWYAAAAGAPPDRVALKVDHCVEGLVAAAVEAAAALLVMTTTGKGALAQAVVGSRLLALAARPPCPLAVVPRVVVPLPAVPRIAVGVDFSPASGATLAFAEQLASALGAELCVVHGFAPPDTPALPSLFAGAEESVRLEAAAALDALAVHHPHTRRALVPGKGPDALLAYVRAEHVDLVVVGSTGHRGLLGEGLGSTPRALIRHLPVPVVVVPPGS